MRRTRLFGVIVCLLGCCACQSMYYGTMEQFGQHKRDILVDRVESARDEQAEAKEQFRSALERFDAVVGTTGGDLRAKYDELQSQLDRSEDAAKNVRDRIESVEEVALALFEEWEAELDQYTNADMRIRSEESLRQTRERCRQLIGAMRRAERRMEPVLVAFRDNVLFLKHNLNAQAIASLQGEVVSLESDVSRLIAEMEAAIEEADAFIESMGAGGG